VIDQTEWLWAIGRRHAGCPSNLGVSGSCSTSNEVTWGLRNAVNGEAVAYDNSLASQRSSFHLR
jgi:hypothetical protein